MERGIILVYAQHKFDCGTGGKSIDPWDEWHRGVETYQTTSSSILRSCMNDRSATLILFRIACNRCISRSHFVVETCPRSSQMSGMPVNLLAKHLLLTLHSAKTMTYTRKVTFSTRQCKGNAAIFGRLHTALEIVAMPSAGPLSLFEIRAVRQSLGWGHWCAFGCVGGICSKRIESERLFECMKYGFHGKRCWECGNSRSFDDFCSWGSGDCERSHEAEDEWGDSLYWISINFYFCGIFNSAVNRVDIYHDAVQSVARIWELCGSLEVTVLGDGEDEKWKYSEEQTDQYLYSFHQHDNPSYILTCSWSTELL